jgi:predicted Zn-dependent protease
MHRLFTFSIFIITALTAFAQNATSISSSFNAIVKNASRQDGFFTFYYDDAVGKIWLSVPVNFLNKEFLYVNSLPAGVGSNDIGLDRNQLGNTRIVYFTRNGNKILLVQPNYDYRAVSTDAAEKASVRDAFATSAIAGFKVEAEEDGKLLIDLTSFLMRDAHNVAARLRRANQGVYKEDISRSILYPERIKNFPNNTEFEAIITFAGEATGNFIRSVTPSPDALTVRMHHSFIALPDNDYKPRVSDPRAGYFTTDYMDYATPISSPIMKRLINRHRLVKKNPDAEKSEAVKPIVYYLDSGTPEPIRSALLDGARWWNEAFEAAGFINAFQVYVLPAEVDPMDVRYNVINWVHRSTRGWSYGSSVTDPRTGEIIKGHVALGSLRVRQDFMIAQGMLESYQDGSNPDPRLLEMALSRLRQLAAHEVGHTLGVAHNFAASVNQNASVMDYPHPLFQLTKEGKLDFSQVYDKGIGEWDKMAIRYGYTEFPRDEQENLLKILKETREKGLHYLTDQDARPMGSAHPLNHMWDNGASPVDELIRMTAVREKALQVFGEKTIPREAPMASLENVLVPLYLSHRYQVEAVAKMIGGVHYTYAGNGDGQVTNKMIEDEVQRKALRALLSTLQPSFLRIPERIIQLIPPQPPGYERDRELFKIYTGNTFDPLAAAEASAEHTLKFLLAPERLARMIEQSARSNAARLSVNELFSTLLNQANLWSSLPALEQEIGRIVHKRVVNHLLDIAGDRSIMQQVSAFALDEIRKLETKLLVNLPYSSAQKAHHNYLLHQIRMFKENPADFSIPTAPSLPDGAPIGCE